MPGARWAALGTTAGVVVEDPAALPEARRILERELAAIDRACSRFRPDSELARVNAGAGGSVPVSPLFLRALSVAQWAAEVTGGTVDPTVGRALERIGYDRDFAALGDSPERVAFRAVPGWRVVRADAARGTVEVPRGVVLDLGATAKALAADDAAGAAARALGAGVLVDLGGDIAVAGPAPEGGWRVRICEDHRAPAGAPGETVTIASGGLATSSTTVRSWRRAGGRVHHVIDPATGAPAAAPWRTVTVAAATCLEANVASTAALVRGSAARAELEALGLPARLVGRSGGIVRLGDWPAPVVESVAA